MRKATRSAEDKRGRRVAVASLLPLAICNPQPSTRRFGRLLRVAAVAICFSCLPIASAHVGDQNVFFEGQAGPFPVRIVVRPPGVIPGLAEISVRVETNGVRRVSALPMRWNSGREGAPPPDEAKPVRGESNLYSTQLWFMRGGAQSVEIAVEGVAGVGKVIVPVNAVATRLLGMSRPLGAILAVLGTLVLLLAISIMGAAVRESVLPAGVGPGKTRRWSARGIVTLSAVVLTALLWFGKTWWDSEAADYRNNRLYRPLACTASVRVENGQRVLTLRRIIEPGQGTGPLVPEHGKLMHLFLVRAPGMDAFAHLHPTKIDYKTFETSLPALPAGNYRLYADVTYETGFSDTLTNQITVPGSTTVDESRTTDSDDSWRLSEGFADGAGTNRMRQKLSPSLFMDLVLDGPLVENRDTRLRFTVRDEAMRPANLEPFMGMAAHLIVHREDGAVFTHLHPSGSYSMAAQQLFELRADGKAPLKVASVKGDPLCKLPVLAPTATNSLQDGISFPYAFPKAGRYRLWAQVKVGGKVLTGVFDVNVLAAANARYANAGSIR